ncbi:MAG TPA: AEC family transporter [Burkholderiaceae bacterium]|nr:AEC family transporter [Burkholderiaceae bacterium]
MNGLSWMAQYVHILGVLLPVFVCAGIGASWAVRKMSYPNEFISVLVTSVTTPALVFHTILTTDLHDTMLLQILVATCAAIAIMACVSAVLLYALRLPVASLLPTATFPNGGNLGLPISYFAFGEIGLAVAVSVFAIFSLTQHTLGVGLLSWSGRAQGSVKRRWPLGMALSCGAAVILRMLNIGLPTPVLASAQLVGSITVPLMLISLGYALATVSRSSLGTGSLVGGIRLLAGLIGALVVIHWLDLPTAVASAIALQLLMPVAVVSYLYSERFTNVGAVSAGAVLVSTGIFFVLSPVLIAWMSGRA